MEREREGGSKQGGMECGRKGGKGKKRRHRGREGGRLRSQVNATSWPHIHESISFLRNFILRSK